LVDLADVVLGPLWFGGLFIRAREKAKIGIRMPCFARGSCYIKREASKFHQKKKEKEASKALVQRGMLATRIMASRRNRVKNMVIVDPRNGTVQI
jgi:hypothetical protein